MTKLPRKKSFQDFVTYTKVREIIEIKNKRNITFFVARRIEKSYMEGGENIYTIIAQRESPIRINNQPDNYRALQETNPVGTK